MHITKGRNWGVIRLGNDLVEGREKGSQERFGIKSHRILNDGGYPQGKGLQVTLQGKKGEVQEKNSPGKKKNLQEKRHKMRSKYSSASTKQKH